MRSYELFARLKQALHFVFQKAHNIKILDRLGLIHVEVLFKQINKTYLKAYHLFWLSDVVAAEVVHPYHYY